MSWGAIQPDSSEYGGRTVIGLAWPHVDEFLLAIGARSLEKFRDDLRSLVIADLRRQMMALSDAWEGSGAEVARDEASAIIDEHEENANLADIVAKKLRQLESTVAETKRAVNDNAESTQHDCEQTNLRKDLTPEERSALNELRVSAGFNTNVGVVSRHAMELADELGVRPGTPGADGKVPGDAESATLPEVPQRVEATADKQHMVEEPTYFAPISVNGTVGGTGSSGGQPSVPPPQAPDVPAPPQPAQSPA